MRRIRNKNTSALSALLFALTAVVAVFAASPRPREDRGNGPSATNKIKPKVFIFSMFDPEGLVWFNIPEFNVLASNITVVGFSRQQSQAHCTKDGSICQLTTAEAEINAASTITSLLLSPKFDLTTTYFLIAGIAGVNPKLATTGSATFGRYAVQVGLQIEFDAREKPPDFPTGYTPQGTTNPSQYPTTIYGTEVFELNDSLRKLAVGFASKANLSDNDGARAYRKNYATNPAFKAGASPPSVVECDTATSDVFWTGTLLGEAFENTTRLFTNGSAVYCSTQQEDNGTLEALMRGAINNLVDFTRIIHMRTGSDFDRPFDGETAALNIFGNNNVFGEMSDGLDISLENIHLAGVKIIEGIISGWDKTFEKGVKPSNYVGDILGTLGGQPDFGPGNIFGGKPPPHHKRAYYARRQL